MGYSVEQTPVQPTVGEWLGTSGRVGEWLEWVPAYVLRYPLKAYSVLWSLYRVAVCSVYVPVMEDVVVFSLQVG